MIYQGARTEWAKRLYIFAVCLVLITSMVQLLSIQPAYALADPVQELAPLYEGWTPEVIQGGLEAVSASGHPEAALAIMAAIGGIYLSTETRGFLPRIMDIWLATNPDITEQEKYEIKKNIWKLDRDGYIYMADLTYWIRKPIFDLAQEIRLSIANDGKFTIEDIVITEEDLVNPEPGTTQQYIVAVPQMGATSWTFYDTASCPEILHPPGAYDTSDTDGSYHDRLDAWRIHAYMYTLRLDYFTSAGDQIRNYWNLNQNVFNDYWDGNPFSISLSDQGIYFNGELIVAAEDLAYPDPVRFTGHSDITIHTNAERIHVQAEIPEPVEVQSEDMLNDGEDWAEDMGDQITGEVIDPETDLGNSMVVIPEGDPDQWVVGEISPANQSVLQPIPESMPDPYQAPDPYPGGGLGDLPVDVPENTDSANIPRVRNIEGFKDHFPFSLPWDIQRIFDLFNRYAATPPSFEVSLGDFIVDSSSQSSSQTFEINLEWMQDAIPFIHTMEIILADLMLIMWILRHFVAG